MPHRRLNDASVRACVFCGPSLSAHVPEGVDVRPPASRGDVIAAVRAGYRAVGFIDGAVEPGHVVPLTELKTVLAMPGLVLVGGASMGAVRAAQLQAVGMRGIGCVFRLLRRGSLTDDEVFLLHAPQSLRYRPLTIPLVNIRFTMRRLRRAGCITLTEEEAAVATLRDVPWFDRDRQALSAAVYRACGGSRSARVLQLFERLYRDVKREDAIAVCSAVQRHRQLSHRDARLPARAA